MYSDIFCLYKLASLTVLLKPCVIHMDYECHNNAGQYSNAYNRYKQTGNCSASVPSFLEALGEVF